MASIEYIIARAFNKAKKYHDEHSGGNAIMVGTVTNGGSFPTARPNGDALVIGDFVKPATSSTFPFTISGITFMNASDQAVFDGNGNWMYNANPFQSTEDTPVKTLATESISGTAATQKAVNIESVEYTKQKEFSFTTASDSWTCDHNLNKYSNVVCFDTSNNTIIGNVTHTNKNTVTISFNTAQSGKAIVN